MEENKLDTTVEKKIKGRKRQLSVDKYGIPLTVEVKSAYISDTALGVQTMNQLARKFPKLKAVSADDGYKVKTKEAAKKHGIKLYVAKRIGDGFKVLPKRWIVERTFAWFNNFRILSKDYCRKTACAMTEILIASTRIVMNKIIKLRNQ
jgi:putative transposase